MDRLPGMRHAIPTALFLLLGALTACKVGPDYSVPTSGDELLPAGFAAVDDPAFVPGDADLRTWWTVFEDAMLEELIGIAAERNQDLRIAIARVDEARARLGGARGARQPAVDVGGSASLDGAAGITRDRAAGSVEVAWEVDLFGRVSSTIDAAGADFEATAEDRRDVQVSLFAEVAQEYFSLRALQERLAAAGLTMETQARVLQFAESRFRNGISSKLEVTESTRVLASSEAEVASLRIELARTINRLSVLVGMPPVELHGRLSVPQPVPVPPATVTVGVPAELLRQRPDIRAAERRLAAETARIGIATADLYPQLSLVGGLQRGVSTGDLLNPASTAFSLGPSLRWSVFNRGRVRAEIGVAEARTEQALLAYERTVLYALGEIESALTSFVEQGVRVDALERAYAASSESLTLSESLYRDGLASFQEVLEAQQATFQLGPALAEARGLACSSLVDLYKGLGGGWDPEGLEAIELP